MNQLRVKCSNPVSSILHKPRLTGSFNKLSRIELPAKEHFERYMRHKWRLNHKPSTLQGSFTSVRLFLDFYGKSGKRDLSEMERADLEAFIEHRAGPRITDLHGADATGLHYCFSAFPDGAGRHLRCSSPEETH